MGQEILAALNLTSLDEISLEGVHDRWNKATERYRYRDYFLTHLDRSTPDTKAVRIRQRIVDEMAVVLDYKDELLRRFPQQVSDTILSNEELDSSTFYR